MANTGKIREIRERLLDIYGNRCWMGYTVCRENPFTVHHIHERRNGGKDVIENAAALTVSAHYDLNQLDAHAKDLYKELNLLFFELNRSNCPPTIEYFKEINRILLFANKKIHLSKYCNLKPDFSLMEESLAKDELEQKDDDGYIKIDGIYMPVSYDTRKIPYVKEMPKELISIPIEYCGKVKHKNRYKSRYVFK